MEEGEGPAGELDGEEEGDEEAEGGEFGHFLVVVGVFFWSLVLWVGAC